MYIDFVNDKSLQKNLINHFSTTFISNYIFF